LDSMTRAFEGLARNALDASNDMGVAKDSFKALNIEVVDGEGNLKSTQQLFKEVVGALSEFVDGAAKSAFAQKLLGSAGVELIPVFNQGEKGLERLTKRFAQLGGQVGDVEGILSEQFNDALNESGFAIGALLRTAIVPLLPALTKFIMLITESANLLRQFVSAATEGGKAIAKGFNIALANTTVVVVGFVAELRAIVEKIPIFIQKAFAIFDGEFNAELEAQLERITREKEATIQAATEDFFNAIQEAGGAFDKAEKQLVEERTQRSKPAPSIKRETDESKKEALGPGREEFDEALRDRLAFQETQLILAKRTTDERIKLIERETAVIKANLALQLNDVNLTANERILLTEQANQEVIDITKESFDEMTSLAMGAAADIQGAFQDLFFDAFNNEIKSLEDVVQIFGDIAKDVASEALSELATSALTGGGAGGGGALGSLAGQLAGAFFKAGGVVKAKNRVTRAQGGGIVQARRGGQPIIAGEGGQNEAIVPLPDGRAIPVTMQKSGDQVIDLTIVNEVKQPQAQRTMRPSDVINIVNADMQSGGTTRKTIKRSAR